MNAKLDEIVAQLACAVVNLNRASEIAKEAGLTSLHESIEEAWADSDVVLQKAKRQARKQEAGV